MAWNLDAIEPTRSLERRRVDGVGRPNLISTQVVWGTRRRQHDILVGFAGRHVLRVRVLLDVWHRRRALGNKLE